MTVKNEIECDNCKVRIGVNEPAATSWFIVHRGPDLLGHFHVFECVRDYFAELVQP